MRSLFPFEQRKMSVLMGFCYSGFVNRVETHLTATFADGRVKCYCNMYNHWTNNSLKGFSVFTKTSSLPSRPGVFPQVAFKTQLLTNHFLSAGIVKRKKTPSISHQALQTAQRLNGRVVVSEMALHRHFRRCVELQVCAYFTPTVWTYSQL